MVGVMPRPEPATAEQGEVEKWEAWNAKRGMSRTAAKKAYIGTLIRTMHLYASSTAEARELVQELEFVWEQVRASSEVGSGEMDGGGREESGRNGEGEGEGEGLRLVGPVSEEGEEEEGERYLTAEDGEDGEREEGVGVPRRERDWEVRNRKWRRRMEAALVRLAAEVAALREVVEEGGGVVVGRKRWVWWVWGWVRRGAVDAVVLGLVVWVWRRRREGREGLKRVWEVWRSGRLEGS